MSTESAQKELRLQKVRNLNIVYICRYMHTCLLKNWNVIRVELTGFSLKLWHYTAYPRLDAPVEPMAVKSCVDNRAQRKVNLFAYRYRHWCVCEELNPCEKMALLANSFSCKWKLLPLVGLEARDKKEFSKS